MHYAVPGIECRKAGLMPGDMPKNMLKTCQGDHSQYFSCLCCFVVAVLFSSSLIVCFLSSFNGLNHEPVEPTKRTCMGYCLPTWEIGFLWIRMAGKDVPCCTCALGYNSCCNWPCDYCRVQCLQQLGAMSNILNASAMNFHKDALVPNAGLLHIVKWNLKPSFG